MQKAWKRIFISVGIILLLVLLKNFSSSLIHKQRLYVYCDLLETGKTVEEIEDSLSMLGPHTHKFDFALEYISYVRYDLGYIKRLIYLGTPGRLMLWWDEDGKLEGVGKNVGIGDWGDVESCVGYIQDN